MLPLNMSAEWQHWVRLHRFAFTLWDSVDRHAWFAAWLESIPNTTCDCRAAFLQLIADCPPPLDDRAAFFVWSVDRHNDVNAKLNKPVMAIDQAYEIYRAWGLSQVSAGRQ
jgi:hypothetical protein